eukprot:tig00020556_g11011.t1
MRSRERPRGASSSGVAAAVVLLVVASTLAVVCAKRAFDVNKDYYKTLGVEKSASAADIKKNYRELALKNHPDKNPSPEAVDIFREIAEAYEILSDEDLRKEYDDAKENGLPSDEWEVHYWGQFYKYYAGAPHHELAPTVAVLIGMFTIAQYAYSRYRYTVSRDRCMKHPMFRQRVNLMMAELRASSVGSARGKKTSKREDEELRRVAEERVKTEQLRLLGREPPKVSELYVFALTIFLPWNWREWSRWLKIQTMWALNMQISVEDRIWMLKSMKGRTEEDMEKLDQLEKRLKEEEAKRKAKEAEEAEEERRGGGGGGSSAARLAATGLRRRPG